MSKNKKNSRGFVVEKYLAQNTKRNNIKWKSFYHQSSFSENTNFPNHSKLTSPTLLENSSNVALAVEIFLEFLWKTNKNSTTSPRFSPSTLFLSIKISRTNKIFISNSERWNLLKIRFSCFKTTNFFSYNNPPNTHIAKLINPTKVYRVVSVDSIWSSRRMKLVVIFKQFVVFRANSKGFCNN